MKTTADKLNQWQRAHKKWLAFAAITALAFVVALNLWQDSAIVIKATPLLYVGVFFCMANLPKVLSRRQVLPFAVFGALVGFFMTADPLVYTVDGVTRKWTLLAVPFFLLFAAVATLASFGLSNLLTKTSLQDMVIKENTKRTWALYFGAMLLFWLPVTLSFGPLRISADSYNVIQQALGNYPLNDSHPILYTLLLRLFLLPTQRLGSITVGAYLFGAVQLCFFAGVLSYSLYWLRRHGAPALYVMVAFLYFALSPVFAINGITVWKDIPFNAVLLLFCLRLHAIAVSDRAALQTKGGMAHFLGLCLALCFLRGNGFYIVLVCMLYIALLYRRHWRRWLAVFVPLLLVVQLVLGPVYAAFGIQRLGGVESAALPLQQVARAVRGGAPLTEEQTEILERIIPVQSMKDAYVSASPDPIKTHPDFDGAAFDANFGPFMKVWAQLFTTNKQVYLEAWLLQTLGYWKVDFHGWTALTSEFELDTGITQHDVWQEAFGIHSRDFFGARTTFLSLSLMAYMVLFCAAHCIATGRAKLLLFFAPMLVLWAGLMLGAPAYAEFRYLLLLPLALPAMLFVTVGQKVAESP